VGAPDEERPVLLDGDEAFDLRGMTDDLDGAFLGSGGLDRVREAAEAGELPSYRRDAGERVGAPIARPSAVICIGMNYAAHAAESGAQPPEVPIIFHKTPNTVVGPNDPVTLPPNSTRTDWEVELGVVIGRRTAYLASPEDALAQVAGFVLCNDLSERHFQLEASGGQWSKGKSAPGFCPTGPWLVTPDEVDHRGLRLRSWVNGEPRQHSSTADMVFGVEHLLWDLSQYLTLEPGDLVLTGTPEGVALSGRFPYLAPGDVVELDIDGLGRQRQDVVAFHG
jgi:2-keto-4-pentenoate hydratase/2-oxohepta-3-ene-1,7-dioic acid hydratase in catechol pathway